jgi:hypothetical protein
MLLGFGGRDNNFGGLRNTCRNAITGEYAKQRNNTTDLRAKPGTPLNASSSAKSSCPVEGYRIIDLQHVGRQMVCDGCCEKLSFEDLEEEITRGLASVFTFRCPTCKLTKKVGTSAKQKNGCYEINIAAVIGKNTFAIIEIK